MEKSELSKYIPKVNSQIMDSDTPYFEKPAYQEAMRRVKLGFSKKEKLRSFDDFKPELQPTEDGRKDAKRLKKRVMEWSKVNPETDEDNAWLTLIGGVGIGKTHLLKSAILETKGYYITAYDFDKRIKDFRSQKDNFSVDVYVDPDKWLDRFANMQRHLVIDDIGAGYIQRGWTQSRFERLIDIRYREKLPTAIATNFEANKLEQELGARIISRITDVEYSVCLILNNAEDMRRVKR